MRVQWQTNSRQIITWNTRLIGLMEISQLVIRNTLQQPYNGLVLLQMKITKFY